MDNSEWTRCAQCGKPMNPVEALLGDTCGKCFKRSLARVTGDRPHRRDTRRTGPKERGW
jgi:predicted  nucleic acid-binding Zn-ribbon protein